MQTKQPNQTTKYMRRGVQPRSGADMTISYPIAFPDDSPYTKQEFKNECDINTIMAQYQYNGTLPNIDERTPQFFDCTGIDFQSAQEAIREANELFMELPSKIRNTFQNDPGQFLDFCQDENNRPQLAEWGLLAPKNTSPIPNPQPTKTNSTKSDSEALTTQPVTT